MKKLMSVLVVMAMVLMGVAAYASVPSKTTTDITTVEAVESTSGVELAADFAIAVTQDSAPVAQEIEKLYSFVKTQGSAPIAYFPAEVQEMIQLNLTEGYDIKALELNEFVSIEQFAYDAAYGDIVASFAFATEYSVDQKLFAVIGCYSGAVDANGNYLVEWVVADAQATEDGQVKVTFTQDVLTQIQNAEATSMAILSESLI